MSITEPKADEETIDEKLSNRRQRPYQVGIPEFRLKFGVFRQFSAFCIYCARFREVVNCTVQVDNYEIVVNFTIKFLL